MASFSEASLTEKLAPTDVDDMARLSEDGMHRLSSCMGKGGVVQAAIDPHEGAWELALDEGLAQLICTPLTAAAADARSLARELTFKEPSAPCTESITP